MATKVLLVDDDVDLQEILQICLSQWGFEVAVASDGKAAGQMADSFRPDIVLSDVMMPDMSGPVVAQLLRKRRPDMRVMLMSGYPDGDMLFLNHGWHFIEKPFLPAKLIERVNEVLHTPERSQGDYHFDTRIKPKRQGSGA